jgi:hypothetical protein
MRIASSSTGGNHTPEAGERAPEPEQAIAVARGLTPEVGHLAPDDIPGGWPRYDGSRR